VATYPQDADQRDQLIRIADERLYHFKHRSRDEAVAERSVISDAATPTASVPPPQAASQTPASVQTPPASHSANPPEAPPPTPLQVAPAPPPPAAPTSPLQTARPSFPLAPEEARIYAVPRKAERVSMSGTNAYAVLADQPLQRARVVDLGF